jgi:hypothetical protein
MIIIPTFVWTQVFSLGGRELAIEQFNFLHSPPDDIYDLVLGTHFFPTNHSISLQINTVIPPAWLH